MYFVEEGNKTDFVDILVNEFTDVVSETPNRREFDLEASSGDKDNTDGGIDTKVEEDRAATSLKSIETAVIVGTAISMILQ